MFKEELINTLNSTTAKDMPEFFVMSYNRGGKVVTIDKIISDFEDEALKHCHLVVREEQADEYYEYNKALIERGLNLLKIPSGAVTGVGSTRNFVMDYAAKIGADVAFNFDDDLDNFNASWEGYHKRTGEKMSCCPTVAERKEIEHYYQKVVQYTANIAREIFAKYPDVAVGNVRKQRFSNGAENAEIKFRINRGSTPRQTNIYNVKLISEKNLRTPMQFDKHGDDIGFAAYLLENGYSLFNIPCVNYSYVPETKASTLRDIDEEKNRGIHEEEYKNLMDMEVKNYFRITKRYDDGDYMYGDINFMKFSKFKNKQPVIEKW